MPTNRKRIDRGRIDFLTIRQRAWLMSGCDILPAPGEAGIEDEAHARTLWIRHRDDLLADDSMNCNRPGRRPWGFWRFDAGLPLGRHGGFRWPRGCCSEAETVYRHYADAAERLVIEAQWLEAVRLAILQSRGAPRPNPEGVAESFYGVPRRFFGEHGPRIAAEIEAEAAAFRASLRQPGNGASHAH